MPDAVELTIADQGPGVPPDELPHVFERLFRGEKAREHGIGGSGLGLPIARRIVENHGGTLALASEPGRGDDRNDATADRELSRCTARILVAEDDARIASFLVRGLGAEGYDVEQTHDGRSTLAAATSGEFALIILDRMMPGMDGLDVCRRLRAQGQHTRVLMLTARDRLQDKVDGLKGGADDYVTKPFAVDELLARIEALLRRPDMAAADGCFRWATLRLDPAGKSAWRGERRLPLTPREFALLACLMENADTSSAASACCSHVWGRTLAIRATRSSMSTSATCAARSTRATTDRSSRLPRLRLPRLRLSWPDGERRCAYQHVPYSGKTGRGGRTRRGPVRRPVRKEFGRNVPNPLNRICPPPSSARFRPVGSG